MSQHAAAMVVFGVIGLVLFVALALGVGGSTSVETSSIRAVGPESGPAVVGVFADEGLKVLGIRLESSTYRVQVQFTAAKGCLAHLVGGADWPLAAEACQSDVEIVGTVGGSGTTAFGETIVVVEREITRTCYEALEPLRASPWPPSAEACQPSN